MERLSYRFWLAVGILLAIPIVINLMRSPEKTPEMDSSGFVNLSDVVPDAIIEARYFATYNFVGARVDGYLEPVVLYTREAAAALKEVSDDVKARGYRLKVYELPEGVRASKGRAVQNLLAIESDDAIRTYLNAAHIEDPEYVQNHYVTLVTKKGIIKKTSLEDYSNKRSRNKGIKALTIREGDALLDAVLTNGREDIMIAGRDGYCVRFNESALRDMGRGASGVRGINLREGDEVIGVLTYDPNKENASDQTIMVVSEHGFGKRSDPEDYRLTSRGTKGVKTLNITDKTGSLVAIKNVTENDDLMIINRSGLTIRMAVSDTRVAGRATQGVKLISLREGDAIAAVSVVAKSEEETPDEAVGTESAEATNENE